MKLFSCQCSGWTVIAAAFNRGHAVKLIAKEMESKGLRFSSDIPVDEIDFDSEQKGRIILLARGA